MHRRCPCGQRAIDLGQVGYIMAVIAICFSSFIGIMAAFYHGMVLGGTVPQAIATYFAASVVSAFLIGLSALVGSRIPATRHRDATRTEDELEAWQDWMIEEEAELDSLFEQAEERAAPEDFVAPKRKSA